jgi:hypothetical protein
VNALHQKIQFVPFVPPALVWNLRCLSALKAEIQCVELANSVIFLIRRQKSSVDEMYIMCGMIQTVALTMKGER